jgi:hypothetical protein
VTDEVMMDVPQQPMPQSTSPNMTTAEDEQHDQPNTESSQQPKAPLPLGCRAPTKTRRQLIPSQDGPSAISEADEQLGAVNTTPPQAKTLGTLPDSTPVHPPDQSSDSRSTGISKAHTSGLSEPDINSLLKLIQEDDGFEEESKPQRAKVAEAIMAVRDASQSQEWTNLLRGIIILTACLGFPKGNVSETCTWLCVRP